MDTTASPRKRPLSKRSRDLDLLNSHFSLLKYNVRFTNTNIKRENHKTKERKARISAGFSGLVGASPRGATPNPRKDQNQNPKQRRRIRGRLIFGGLRMKGGAEKPEKKDPAGKNAGQGGASTFQKTTSNKVIQKICEFYIFLLDFDMIILYNGGENYNDVIHFMNQRGELWESV